MYALRNWVFRNYVTRTHVVTYLFLGCRILLNVSVHFFVVICLNISRVQEVTMEEEY